MSTFTLANETLRLEFAHENGALVKLSTTDGWDILNREHLGLPFWMQMPLSDKRRNNPVLGEKQKTSSVEVAANGKSATLVWDSITSELGGDHDVKVTLVVSLTDRQAQFALTIENNSEYVIEAAYCPYIGDVQPPPGADRFRTFLYNYASAQQWDLWPTFENMRGYYGVDYPTQFSQWSPGAGAPMSPFALLRSADRGLYIGVTEPSSELVAWHCELRPGYSDAINSLVPDAPTIGGKDVSTRFAAVHMPYIQPGETRALTPVALEAFQGGWQHGVDIYKNWRDTWMKTPEVPDWAQEPHAWQQLHINGPEDELRIRFTDLPKIGEECAKHGVKAIQLVGWEIDGQDEGNPSHTPDPRLGTFDELKEAIEKIHAMGVKMILFSKFTWADRGTERFRTELIKQAIKDPFGDYYQHQGYQYFTPAQLLDINTTRLIPMCFLSEEYLKVCEEEFQKMVDLGAAGTLYDECLHHSPALLCFDESHGHRYGAPVYANDRELIRRFKKLSDKVDKDFLYAGEACYDWEMEVYQASYHRSWEKDHIPLSRYMLPNAVFMTAITGFNDRNMINQCLLYRYVISYEPYNFKGHLDDYPLTVEYGKKMDALRTELREYFWDGEFQHEVGATVTVHDKPHHPYAVFTNKDIGKTGIAIANYDETEPVTIEVKLDDGSKLTRYRLVDDPEWHPTVDGISIPPRSAAVVV